MKARHARSLKIIGEPVSAGDCLLVPAGFKLEGTMFTPCFALADVRKEHIPPILRLPIEKGFDVAWVRGRLPRVFTFDSPLQPSENEKTFLEVGFVAVPREADEGIAFLCSDHYGRTSLYFSPQESDLAAKRQVAGAFWRLLLSEPEDVEDFEGNVMHLGAPLILHFGCEDGEPFMYETPI